MSLQYRKGYAISKDLDFSNNHTSDAYKTVGAMTTGSLQLHVSTGTLTGTWEIQKSNDPNAWDPTLAATANWVTMKSVAVDAATATDYMVEFANGSGALRYKWTHGTNSGTASVYFYGTNG